MSWYSQPGPPEQWAKLIQKRAVLQQPTWWQWQHRHGRRNQRPAEGGPIHSPIPRRHLSCPEPRRLLGLILTVVLPATSVPWPPPLLVVAPPPLWRQRVLSAQVVARFSPARASAGGLGARPEALAAVAKGGVSLAELLALLVAELPQPRLPRIRRQQLGGHHCQESGDEGPSVELLQVHAQGHGRSLGLPFRSAAELRPMAFIGAQAALETIGCTRWLYVIVLFACRYLLQSAFHLERSEQLQRRFAQLCCSS